ncbi:MAG: hypothetical protein HGB03_03915 [Candidatus Yonathbacteria bacterium]|nr:hypothetical protein [Candidatus Yonathbacteria bacterium]NTW47622.1 hypothetical protein [Candidatus Yonathbacteria bacterium]
MAIDIKHILKGHAYQNIPLTFEEAYALGEYAIKGCNGDTQAQIQSVIALSALHTKATYVWEKNPERLFFHDHRLPMNAAEQIAGICAAIFKSDIATSEYGTINTHIPLIMDNCGMGGDITPTANVSTIAALIASVAGIHMCKHGSPANADTGKHGSSDFMQMLGIETFPNRDALLYCLEKECFGYTEALDTRYKIIHKQTHSFANVPHMNDIIGPITNPVVLTRRILGVNHLISPKIVAEAYAILNKKNITVVEKSFFIRGYSSQGGMDELSICPQGSQVAILERDNITVEEITANDFGIQSVSSADISPPKGMSKGEFSKKILYGEITGPALEMVLANAALLMHLAQNSHVSLPQCFDDARRIHASGELRGKVARVKTLLQRR